MDEEQVAEVKLDNTTMDEKLGGRAIQDSAPENLIAKSTFPYEQNVTSKFSYQQDNVKKDWGSDTKTAKSAATLTFSEPTLLQNVSPDLKTTAEGLTSSTSSTSSTNLLNPISQTYDSMFGKYGFYMSIDSDGEYVLNVMDYEFEYKAYLKKYEPEKYQDNTKDNAESNPNDATNVQGGKRKTIRQKYYKRKTQKDHKKTNKKYTLKTSNIKKSNIKMSNKRNTKRVKLHS
jgi:hypothetical protein